MTDLNALIVFAKVVEAKSFGSRASARHAGLNREPAHIGA